MSVTLFKSGSGSVEERDDSDDKFFRALRHTNFTRKIIPVVAFEFCGLDILWRELQNHQHYEGLIFTSPRCVQSVKKAMDSYDKDGGWEKNMKSFWMTKPMFCVGPSTVEVVKETFFHKTPTSTREEIFVSDKGNSASLGETIVTEVRRRSINLPLLYPCGNLKTDTLGEILREHQIPFKTLVVYHTVKNPELERNPAMLSDASSHKGPDIYVFFSPSGLNFALPHLVNVSSKKFVALGPTTRQALESIETIPPDNIYQCKAPTPEGLLAVLEEIMPS